MEWSLLIKIIVALAIGSFLYSCFGKKKKAEGLEAWLGTHFKDQLYIVSTQTADPIRHLSFKVKNTIVAHKDDSLLQIFIRWDKRQDDLGISLEEVKTDLVKAKTELADARSLLQLLKETGLTSFSCSIRNGYIRILIFEEPTPEYRLNGLEKIIPALQNWPQAKEYGLAIDFMEAKTFTTEFGDIVPLEHWERADRWQLRNSLVFQRSEVAYPLNVKTINQEWQFNTESDRLLEWIEQARILSDTWAKEHLKKTYKLLPQAQYSALDKQLGVEIQIPFNYSTNSEDSSSIDGYITGNYLFDAGKLGPLKVVKE